MPRSRARSSSAEKPAGARRPRRAGARDRILDAASRLFYAEGIHATGIDRVIAEAGVAKMSLYAHFASKDELIAAVLERSAERWFEWFGGEVGRRASDPVGRLLAAFDVIGEWHASPNFRGCTFSNASAEFGDASHPARAVAAAFKARTRAWMTEQAASAGLRHPEALGTQLAILTDGATSSAAVAGPSGQAAIAKDAARVLIDASRPA